MNNYVGELIDKFNKDKNDPTITESERVLLNQILQLNMGISELSKKAEGIMKDIDEKQGSLQELNGEILMLRGQVRGVTNSLILLKENEEKPKQDGKME